MFNRIKLLAISLLVVASGCNRIELAESAQPKDFNGNWTGKWNWDPSKVAILNITNGLASISGFPEQPSNGLQHIEVEFNESYGSKGAPAVLLFVNEPNVALPIYVTKDKKQLIYTYDINFDQRIFFVRAN